MSAGLIVEREIISDDEILRVRRKYDNWLGEYHPRVAVRRAVIQIAFGYSVGSTTYNILRDHELVRKRVSLRNPMTLTRKGYRYLKASYNVQNLADIQRSPIQ